MLTGVFIAWLSLTPEGKKVRDMAINKLKEEYLKVDNKGEEKEKKDVATE